MFTETSSGDIQTIVPFWFLQKKVPVRVEIHQKSVTEMSILWSCSSPQNESKNTMFNQWLIIE